MTQARSVCSPDHIAAREGEGVTLVSGLKLCRKVIHREPVIELIGVDPYRFAEIRSLGLINEQIDWKQRFFVPNDEEIGVAVLADLLSRYPVVVSEVSGDDEPTAEIESSDLLPPKIVDLDEWFIPVTTSTELIHVPEPPPIAKKSVELGFVLTPTPDWFSPRPHSGNPRETQLALEFE